MEFSGILFNLLLYVCTLIEYITGNLLLYTNIQIYTFKQSYRHLSLQNQFNSDDFVGYQSLL